MRRLARTVILSLLAATLAGCGDDCVGAARFTGEDGLVALGACGDFATPTPTATATPAP